MKISITHKLSDITGVRKYQMNMFFSDEMASLERSKRKDYCYIYSESFIVPVIISKPAIFCYASFVTEPFKYGKSAESIKDFLNASCEYLMNSAKIQWLSMNNPASMFMDYPDRARHIPFGNHVVDLSLAEEELFKNIHSKHRNVIKKAEKYGIVVISGRTDKLIQDYHSIDVLTWERSKKGAASLSSLKSILKTLGNKAIVYMAYKEGEPQSGAIFYYNQAMCYYMFGANANSPYTGSGNLLQWKAMLDMKANGVMYYSFVGCRINEDENSKYHGIQRFKERFGGELVRCYLFKCDFKPFMRKLFDFFITARLYVYTGNITRTKDIIDQEAHKWENSQTTYT